MLADHKWKVVPRLAPGTGTVATGTFDLPDTALSAQAFEAHADRFDLLD
jgi:hypothetical protein